MFDRSVLCKIIIIGATAAALSFGGCLASSKLIEFLDAKEGFYMPSDEISKADLTRATVISSSITAMAVTAAVAYYSPKENQDDDEDDYDDDEDDYE